MDESRAPAHRTLSIGRLRSIAGRVRRRLASYTRRLVTRQPASLADCRAATDKKVGLEIGGPSTLFARGELLSIYPHVERLDNVNFARHTLWDGTIAHDAYVYDRRRPPGHQFIGEASDLSSVPDGQYDFVLSSHMLEHTANPLLALAEWRRVLRPGGALVLVVPHRDATFDHRRPVTPIEHLRDDLARSTDESDTTHVEEILALHDISRDPGAGDMATFRTRVERNVELRSLHHHVFDTRLVLASAAEAGFVATGVDTLKPHHILVVARKSDDAASIETSLDGPALEAALQGSIFASDRT